MATRLYVRLQTPTIELPIEAKDVAQTKDKFIVGFRRYELDPTQKKFEALQVLQRQSFAIAREKVRASRVPTAEEQEAIDKEEKIEIVMTEQEAELATTNFIKAEIVYLRDVKLQLIDDETGKTINLIIPDTREAKPNADLWNTPDECLDVLLSLYLSSAPYRLALLNTMQKALLNNDYEDGLLKNF